MLTLRIVRIFYRTEQPWLAIGMACFMIIMLWVQDELSYDRFHENLDKIYRLTWKISGEEKYSLATPAPLAEVLRDECPELVNSTKYARTENLLFRYKERQFEEKVSYADSRFPEILTFPFVLGNPETALEDPSSIIITEEMAKKYFPDENPIGKVLTLHFSRTEEFDLIVTGIIKNI
jgi:putative ABC transport system permease protein